MRKDQLDSLVAAQNRYPSGSEDDHYDEILDEIHQRITTTGSVGKSDIGALMLWKRLNLNTRWARSLNNESDKRVREITSEAIGLASSGDIPEAARDARTALRDLPGCRSGAAVASTILTAAWPERMAVYDRHAAKALTDLNFEHPHGRYSVYMASVCTLADQLSDHTGAVWLPRDVDKALFEWRN